MHHTTEQNRHTPTIDKLTQRINERINLFNDILPCSHVPVKREIYFKTIKNLFPDEISGSVFLGQFLMKPMEWFTTTSDQKLRKRIIDTKRGCGITDLHCHAYAELEKYFNRMPVLSVFDIEPSFFAELTEVCGLSKQIDIAPHTKFGDPHYKELLGQHARMNHSDLLTDFYRLHLHVFIDWIQQHTN